MTGPVALNASEAWEQLDTESSRMWALFVRYRDTPAAKRNLTQLARDLSVSKQTVNETAARYRWQERARLYDRYLDRIRLDETRNEIERIARNNALLTLASQSKLAERLKSLSAKDISTKQIPAWLRAVAALEQSVRGMRIEHSGPDGGAIEIEDSGRKERLAVLLGAVVDAKTTDLDS